LQQSKTVPSTCGTIVQDYRSSSSGCKI